MTLLDAYIARGAEEWPEAEAFRFQGEALSYAALNQAAERFAAGLRARGIGPGDRLAILLRRGLDQPVAVYGALRAGAAFVPIDPDAPPARIARILTDCGIRALITSEALRPSLTALFPLLERPPLLIGPGQPVGTVPALALQSLMATPAPGTRPPRDPDDLAYILFTSGSTGTPKGIAHSHASASAYAEMAAALYDLGPGDRLGNHSPLHFDMATFEIFAAPAAGATTVLLSEAHLLLAGSLADLIEAERLTVWYSVPFAIAQLVEHGGLSERDIALRWVIHAGEPMPPKHLEAFRQAVPDVRFSNSYGPTEVNQVTYHHHPPGPIDADLPVPLGRPCPHAEIHLDPVAGEAPDTGELLVATPAMAKGYWRDPARTEAGFVTRTGADGRATRYYRTGDLVRRDQDGVLHFIGRLDRQVKVRGARVELDEVERVLTATPEVTEAAAILAADGLSVHAFVRLAPGAASGAPALRERCAAALPRLSVPSEITLVTRFPRTATGKIDRNALQKAPIPHDRTG